jgi:hypothetical protein
LGPISGEEISAHIWQRVRRQEDDFSGRYEDDFAGRHEDDSPERREDNFAENS